MRLMITRVQSAFTDKMEHLNLRVVLLQLSDDERCPADLVTVHVFSSSHAQGKSWKPYK